MINAFSGKVVLITGAGAGIGRATALAFAGEGATVVAAGRTAESLDQTAQLITAEGGTASIVTGDVSSARDAARIVATTVERHGELHIAFNNAGIIETGPIADLDEAAWDRQIAVNLTGVFLMMKHQIRHMRAHGGGAIVNTASTLGAHLRRPGSAAYAAQSLPIGRVGALDEIASAVLWLASPGAGFAVGHDLVLDGGATA
jgi:NAD(P)-dependent dehydrogenase (short-subunit alcohol dehydrogenase family)